MVAVPGKGITTTVHAPTERDESTERGAGAITAPNVSAS